MKALALTLAWLSFCCRTLTSVSLKKSHTHTNKCFEHLSRTWLSATSFAFKFRFRKYQFRVNSQYRYLNSKSNCACCLSVLVSGYICCYVSLYVKTPNISKNSNLTLQLKLEQQKRCLFSRLLQSQPNLSALLCLRTWLWNH